MAFSRLDVRPIALLMLRGLTNTTMAMKRLTLLLLAFTLISTGLEAKAETVLPSILRLRSSLSKEVKDKVTSGQITRDDGFCYTGDIVGISQFAAMRGDLQLYKRLRDLMVNAAIIDDPEEDYTNGFVSWRFKPVAGGVDKSSIQASSAGEALSLAKALMLGSESFKQYKADYDRAVEVLRGYANHQTEEKAFGKSIWLIRRYYNLQTKNWANTSYLIDYDPDFFLTVSKVIEDKRFEIISHRSAALINSAVSPTGLLKPLVMPELASLVGTLSGVFAPDNIEALSNSAQGAERSVETNKELARNILNFAVKRVDNLHLYYNVRTGERTIISPAGVETIAPLYRLAVKLKDKRAEEKLLPLLLDSSGGLSQFPYEDRLKYAGEALLALEYAVRYHSKSELQVPGWRP